MPSAGVMVGDSGTTDVGCDETAVATEGSAKRRRSAAGEPSLRGSDAFFDLRVISPICPPLLRRAHGARPARRGACGGTLPVARGPRRMALYRRRSPERRGRARPAVLPAGVPADRRTARSSGSTGRSRPHRTVSSASCRLPSRRTVPRPTSPTSSGERSGALGFGTDAVRTMLAFLAEQLAVTRAEATVDERNGASLRLLAKIGFRVVDRSDPRNVRLDMALGPGRVPRSAL